MQTTDEPREHCRFVGKDIEKLVAGGEDLRAQFRPRKQRSMTREDSI